MTVRLTDTAVGELIGLSYVQVNRIRNGTRQPGIEAMLRIEKALGWRFQDQGDARRSGEYPKRFEEAVARYASTLDTTAGPEERSPTPQ